MEAKQSFADLSDESYINDGGIADVVGIKKTTVWRWAKSGKLPAPLRFSTRCTRWRVGDIRAALAALAAANHGGQS